MARLILLVLQIERRKTMVQPYNQARHAAYAGLALRVRPCWRRYVSAVKLLFLASILVFQGCATHTVYSGVAEDCGGVGVAGAEIRAFRHGVVPLTLPKVVGSATSDGAGVFALSVTNTANFIDVVGASVVRVVDQPNLLVNRCGANT